MSQKLTTVIAVVGIDIGKNSFHIVGHDERWDYGTRSPLIPSRIANARVIEKSRVTGWNAFGLPRIM